MLANEIDIKGEPEKFFISTSGLVVEYIVAIDVTQVRFPAGALHVFPLFAALLYLTGSSPLWCWHWGQLFNHFYASDSYCAPKPAGGPR